MNEKDFMEEYNAIFERSLLFSILSNLMGLVSVQNLLDKEKINHRDILEFGMRMITEGRIPELMNKIFTNLINLELDKDRKILKTMQKEAVFSIQQGIPSENLMWILNSYVNIDLDKATEKLNEINEFVDKAWAETFPSRQENYQEMYQNFTEKIVNEFYKRKK